MMPPVKEPLAGLALLVIFGFLIWYNRPNESSRPFDPYPQHQVPRITGDVYEAWLWKDPFGFDPSAGSGGAAEAWARVDKGEKPAQEFEASVGARKGEKNRSRWEPQNLTCQVVLEKMISGISGEEKSVEGRSVQILAPLVKVTPHTHSVENKEMRTRQRYAVIAGLIESGYRPQEPDRLHFCSIQEHSREYDVRWEHYRHEPGNKPDIIVAWIDSEVFTAGEEFLDVVESTAGRDLASRNCALKELLSSEKIIPSAEETGKKFYVFDVSSILKQNRSEQIKQKMGWINNNIELIKPAGMEDKQPQTKGENDKNAEPAKLKSMESEKKCEEPAEKPKPEQRDNKNATGNANGKTGSEKLAEKMAVELALRGINTKKRPEEVIIITEQDSENVATLASDLQNCLNRLFPNKSGKYECGGENPDTTGNEGGPAQISKIRTVFYLKGSDGNPKKTRTQDKKDKNEDQSDDKPDPVSIIDLHRPPPLPIGPGQMDYFYRLAEEIRSVHDTVDFDKRDSGAKAVVILGSDFNDKLLIIEALREKMPHLLILTTGLDAQMLYPEHWRSTRNLVVASHFDLLLRKKTKEDENCKGNFWHCAYQDRFPPFRDSQQTNIFYHTLAIAKGNTSSIGDSKRTFPRIFEVGRNGFVRLSDEENNLAKKENGLDFFNFSEVVSMLWDDAENKSSPDYHPSDNNQKNTASQLRLLAGIALALIYLYWTIRPWSEILSGYFAAGTGGVFAIAYFSGINPSGEPLSFTDGVSLWPTILIQLITILWAITLFFRAICELEVNFSRLSRWYFKNQPSHYAVCLDGNEPDECEPWLKKRLGSSRPWSSRAHSPRGRCTFLVLILTVAVYVLNDIYPSSPIVYFWPCLVFLILFATVYLHKIENWEHVPIGRWMKKKNSCPLRRDQHENSHTGLSFRRLCFIFHFSNKVTSSLDQENYESSLWREYYEHGRFGPRVFRVVAMWLIFAIVETLLVYLLPPWPLPCRGSTCGWASWAGVLSFTVTMLLLFFILDAVRLNFYWTKKLRKQHPLLRERITKEDINAYKRAGKPCPAKTLEDVVFLVAERTQAVDRLIYYPMLCIMLMLFAKIIYFDNQDFPLSKALTFGVAISILFFSGFMLRHEANQLKLSIKKILRDLRVNNGSEEIDETIKRINEIDEGAFQPMLEQPVMQALLIVLASIGLFAGEYLKLFG